MLRGWLNNQHGAPIAVIAQAPPSAEDAFAVLPQDLEAVISISIEPRGWTHLPDPVRSLRGLRTSFTNSPLPHRAPREGLNTKLTTHEAAFAMSRAGATVAVVAPAAFAALRLQCEPWPQASAKLC